jgi:hypothetical protein
MQEQLETTKNDVASLGSLTSAINSELEEKVGVSVDGAEVTSETFDVIVVTNAQTPSPTPTTSGAPKPSPEVERPNRVRATLFYLGMALVLAGICAIALVGGHKLGFIQGSYQPKQTLPPATISRQVSTRPHQGVGPFNDTMENRPAPAPVPAQVPAEAVLAPLKGAEPPGIDAADIDVAIRPMRAQPPSAGLDAQAQVVARQGDMAAMDDVDMPWYKKLYCHVCCSNQEGVVAVSQTITVRADEAGGPGGGLQGPNFNLVEADTKKMSSSLNFSTTNRGLVGRCMLSMIYLRILPNVIGWPLERVKEPNNMSSNDI